jgi:hypothetical protein
VFVTWPLVEGLKVPYKNVPSLFRAEYELPKELISMMLLRPAITDP